MNKDKNSLGSKIFGIIFVIWFFGSMVAMVFFAQFNGLYTIMIFGQCFLVCGLLALFNKAIIGLPFFLVGLACLVIPFFMLNPNLLPVEVNWGGVSALLLLLAFVIAGFCLLFIPLYQRAKRKKLCTITVPATITGYDETYDDGNTLYCPIYEYEFNGNYYKEHGKSYSNVGNKPVGTIVNIKIDPNNPTNYEDNHSSIVILIILGILFLAVSLPLLIIGLINIDKFIK